MLSSICITVRGVGWDFATPDVRHDTNPWQRPSGRQVRRAVFKVGPMLLVTLLGLRAMATYIDLQVHAHWHSDDVLETAGITNLPLVLRPLFVAFTGVSLYALFDFGYTIISAAPLPVLQASASVVQTGSPDDPNPLVPSAHNVDFFPLLNPLGLTAIHSVRSFWSKVRTLRRLSSAIFLLLTAPSSPLQAWHRLFHRAFLIYGIVPFQNMAIRLEYAVQYGHSALTNRPSPSPPFSDFPMGKPSPATYADPGRAMLKGRGDWGKVLGAFVASGIIHAISERAALGGRTALPHMHLFTAKGWQDTQAHLANTNTTGIWTLARLLPPFSGAGELSFFVLNGVAVIVETAIARVVMAYRRKQIDASPDKAASEKGKDSTSSSTTALKPSGGTMFGRSASLSAGKERRASYQDTTSSESDEEVKHSGQEMQMTNGQDEDTPSSDDKALSRWYDIYFQLAWTLTILLSTGELFTEGWIASGVVNEITMVQC